MRRAGITAGLTGLLAVALAVGPVSPSQATRAPSDGARIAAAGTPKPSVTKLAPQGGTTAGGFDVVIKGRNLSGVKKVFFGAVKATDVRVKNAHKVVVRAPAQDAGLVRVRVVTNRGGSKQSEATKFTYVTPAPSLSQLSPRTGPTAGGTTVTLTGSNLSGATSVRFGSTGATSFRVISPTTITAVSPGRPTGPVNITVTTAGGAATLDDAFSYVAAPRLSFVDPGSGPLVATPVTLVGTALTADAHVTFGGVATPVLSASPDGTGLTVNTPAHAPGFVDVTVTTTGGSSTLTHGYRFVAGTTLTAVTPSAGPSSGGETVTLTGSGFTGDTLVTFGNKPSIAVFANLSGTQLTALLPSHAAGTVDVSVATEGGSATLTNRFTYVDAPTLSSISSTAGPTGGGTSVTLTGTRFQAGMQVRFGAVLATGVTVLSATQATALTPAHSAGDVNVSVTTPGGTATLPGSFTYVAVPTLSAVSPNDGPTAGGQTVTLTGTNFRAGMQVSFGGSAATGLVVLSPTAATVITPAHAAGHVNVAVTTPGGPVTLPNGYAYVVLPVLATVTPDNGPTGGGTTVTLAGSGFSPGMQVRFDGVLAFLVSVDPGGTSAVVVNPTHPAGAVDVTVTTPGGTGTRSNGFTYVAVPRLTAVSPDEGPTTGGQTVTLTGTGFRAGLQVSFGGALATGLNVLSATQATVTTPGHAAAVVDVSVSTTGGSVTLPGGYAFVIAPTLSTVAPDEGPSAGGQSVTLSGTGFRAGMQVRFDGDLAVLVSVNLGGTSATVTSPPHAAGVVDVSVTTPGGSATLSNGYTYVAPPTLVSMAPDEGPAAGGTTVTITGVALTGTTEVTFDGVQASFVVVDDTTLTATTPVHAAGLVSVSVTTPGGADTLLDAFTYVAAPTLTLVSPSTGPAAGGTSVTLTGTGFRAGIQVELGGHPATDVVVVSATELTATTPAHADGLVDVLVSTPGGSATLAGGFTYVASPTITAVSPENGPTVGGTSVTITGSNLVGTTVVTFDGVAATDVMVVNDSTVTATTPAHSADFVDVTVSTPGGSATLAFAFEYVAQPTLLVASPSGGPVAGNSSVTLIGGNIAGATSVTFDGVPATNLSPVNDNILVVTTPAHPAGSVDVVVTTPGGLATLVLGYTYVASPEV